MSYSSPSSTSTALPDNDLLTTPPPMSPGPIIGGVIGGVAFLAGLVLVFYLLYRRRSRRRMQLHLPAGDRTPPTSRRSQRRVGTGLSIGGKNKPPLRPASLHSLDLPPLAYEEAEDGRMMPRSPDSVYLAGGKLEEGVARTDEHAGARRGGSAGWMERQGSGYGSLRSATAGSGKDGAWKM